MSESSEPDFSAADTKEACASILCELIEDATLEFCFKIHRALKFGYFPIDEYIIQDGEFILHKAGDPVQNHDLLALAASSKKPSHINCPHCKRKLGTNRFAPHLNSCMGEGGRQVKDRNAKRNFQTYESGDDDDDEDYSDSGKKKKRKPAKNARKVNKNKGKSVQIDLSQKCGVVSRKSKTMCNNTLKCSIHTDEQRREIRRTFIKVEPDSNVHIDVDTVDELSRSPSPSDISMGSVLSVKLEEVNTTPEQQRLTPIIYP